MKTVTQKIDVYEFSELSEIAKEKALNQLCDINVHYNWWEFTYEDAENIGLKINSFDLDRNRHCTGNFLLSACEVAQNILNEHGEICETYKSANEFLNYFNPIFADYLDENSENYESSDLEDVLSDLESEFLTSLLEDYSIMLQHEYEYLTSETAIINTIEANEYTFDVNGNMINL